MLRELMLYKVVEGKTTVTPRAMTISEIREHYGPIHRLEVSGKRIIKVAKIVLQRDNGEFFVVKGE